MNYEQLLREDRRLVILRTLAEAKAYQANSSNIQTVLAAFGIHCSRDQVHTELAWLEDQGLVTTKEVRSVVVATITSHGADVAKGYAAVPGVKKPGPGE